MYSKREFYWNLLGAIIILPINIAAIQYKRHFGFAISASANVTNFPQLNASPEIHKTGTENLTILELVTLSQLQNYIESSIGVRRLNHDSFWISTPYLTNLLDSSQWSLQKAKRKIRKSVNWRNGNENMLKQLPDKKMFDYFDLEIKGFDKEGCPVVIVPFGKWRTLRSYVEKIQSIPEVLTNLKIYLYYVMEEQILQEIKNNEISDCSQFTLIADMEQYHAIHTLGIKFFIEIINLFDRVYPGMLKIAYIINSPFDFLAVAKTFKSRIPWDLRQKGYLYTDKSFWQDALLRNIDASQLSPNYGGTNLSLK